MRLTKHEPFWERRARLFLQICLGALLLVLAITALLKLFVPTAQALADGSTDPAWLGFWGNIVGGVLGLGGGLIAAYAAVRAVERQLNHAEKRREQDDAAIAKEMYRILCSQSEDILKNGNALLHAATHDEHQNAFEHANTIILAWIPESDHYTRYLVERIPTAGLRLEMVSSVRKKWSQTVSAADRYRRASNEIGTGTTLVPDAEHCCLATGAYIAWLVGFIEALGEALDLHRDAEIASALRLRTLVKALTSQAEKLRAAQAVQKSDTEFSLKQ